MKMKKTITKTTLILLLATLLCIGCVTYVYAAVGNAFDAPTCYCGGSTSHIGHGSSEQSWTAGSSIDYCSYTATVH